MLFQYLLFPVTEKYENDSPVENSYDQAAIKEVQIFKSESENGETLRQGKRLKLSKLQYASGTR
ncbi:hypothetical protein QTP88_020982 [Uroleucon formosanum]